MFGRWEYLNNLGDSSNHKVAGFYNNPCIGVCLTNVALAMIMSNRALMKVLQLKYMTCPRDVLQDIENLEHYVRQLNGKNKEQEVSDILIKGVCDTMNNQKHRGAYGLVGDYVLSKYFTAEDKRNMRINPNVMGVLVKENTITTVPTSERLHRLISDMIMVQMVEGVDRSYNFNYYPTIEVLNMELKIDNVKHDPIDVTPFRPNYYAVVGEEIIGNIRKDLTEKKIIPKVIHLGFAPQHQMRFHEMTYINFVSFLDRVKDFQVDEIPPPSFKVYVQGQRLSLPKINNNDNLYYSFPTANGDSNYQLKAASFFIQDEYVALPKDFIQTKNPSQSVRQCTQNFFKKMNVYTNMRLMRNFDDFKNYIGKHIKYFHAMCNALFNVNFYNYFVIKGSVHTFSINRRVEGWVLMNDQHSFKIDNIGEMSEMLKNEVVDAVVLELETEKK
ncbi:hypothetical protein SNEBB_007106 [Seison nebaliae]|nr:hypothetical protein SNEBB_007106 [Seison nebaliae]